MKAYIYGTQRDLTPEFDEFLPPDASAVISIDMHRGHLEDSPDCPCPAPRVREIVAPVNRFHAEARARGIPVIHVRSVLRKGGVDDLNGVRSAWRMTFPLHVGPIPNSDVHAIEGSRWTEFVTEIAEGDLIVSGKKRLSPFYATDLEFLLRQLGTKALVLTGGMSDCCVLNAAFEGSNMGFRVTVAQDLVRGTDAEMEAAAMKMVSLHLGLVMDSVEITAAWDRLGAPARETGIAPR